MSDLILDDISKSISEWNRQAVNGKIFEIESDSVSKALLIVPKMNISTKTDIFVYLCALNLLNAAIKTPEFKHTLSYSTIKTNAGRLIREIDNLKEASITYYYNPEEGCLYIKVEDVIFSFHQVPQTPEILKASFSKPIQWPGIRLQKIAQPLFDKTNRSWKPNIGENITTNFTSQPNIEGQTESLKKQIRGAYDQAPYWENGWKRFASIGSKSLKEMCFALGYTGVRNAIDCILKDAYVFKKGDTSKHEPPLLIKLAQQSKNKMSDCFVTNPGNTDKATGKDLEIEREKNHKEIHILSKNEINEIQDFIKKALEEGNLKCTSDGWYDMPSLAMALKKKGLNKEKYGYPKLTELLKSSLGDSIIIEITGSDCRVKFVTQFKSIELTNTSEVTTSNVTVGDKGYSHITFDKKKLLTLANSVKGSMLPGERDIITEPNGYIVGVNNKSVFVSTPTSPKKQAKANSIIETSLINTVRNFQIGDSIGIISFSHKDFPDNIILLLLPNTVKGYADLLRHAIIEEHYLQAKLLCYFLLDQVDSKSARIPILKIISELKPIYAFNQVTTAIESVQPKTNRKLIGEINSIDKEINKLVKENNIEEAIAKIENLISDNKLDDRSHSNFLLKRAQLYSRIGDYPKAITAYESLIQFNTTHSPKDNNLSHLYTELARIQSRFPELQSEAILNVKHAVRYSGENKYALALLHNLESVNSIDKELSKKRVEYLLEENNADVISRMIDEDISASQFTSPEILNNNGIPTPEIVDSMFFKSIKERAYSKADQYPVFLEIAKGYKMIPTGSYDYGNYISAIAYYAILKGNHIYDNYQKHLSSTSTYTPELVALADSASSYYMESLNSLAHAQEISLLSVLTNYLIINVSKKLRELGVNQKYPQTFSSLLSFCISSNRNELQTVGWSTVIEVGSLSASAWNKLNDQKNGTGTMYGVLSNDQTKDQAFSVINNILCDKIDKRLRPGEFIKKAFKTRESALNNFLKEASGMISYGLTPLLMAPIKDLWAILCNYKFLLKETDHKSVNVINKIIDILSPYVNRQEVERKNLLIQTQKIINNQIRYILANTTYYGRVLFYPLLKRWNNDIQALLDEQVSLTFPQIKVYPDPPYISIVNKLCVINLIIENIGMGTADSYEMEVVLKSKDGTIISTGRDKNPEEIPSGRKIGKLMNLPQIAMELEYIDVETRTTPIYQSELCTTAESVCNFSVQKEPLVPIQTNDILWNDTRIPSKLLFKGREQLLSRLEKHYSSNERDKSYILYGLTRTGKSSILKYLAKLINNKKIVSDGIKKNICCINWDFSTAASHTTVSDFWEYLIYSIIDSKSDGNSNFDEATKADFGGLNQDLRFIDFVKILEVLNRHNYYPFFFVDEFSYISQMIDNGLVGSAFLHQLRQNSLDGKASFIYAGTYDIKKLLSDPQYGITGQLVNSIEYQVGEIDKDAAEQLMRVMEPKLIFSEDAIDRIHELSGDIPYFIQIICKYCGYYAVENPRTVIGFWEVEYVIKLLTGEITISQDSSLKELPPNVFQNNMITPIDPPEINGVISSVCYFNKDNKYNPRGVGMAELENLWGKNHVEGFRPKISEAIKQLLERKIIKQEFDGDLPTYTLVVDLFRRWWTVQHPDIKIELGIINK